jgi:hypothetical protein
LRLCYVTGILAAIACNSAFIYVVWFSYLMKRIVSNPTSNFRKLSIIVHITTILATVAFVLIAGFGFGFGLSVFALYRFIIDL